VPAAAGAAQPDDRFNHFILAVPGNPGDTEYLARADLEADVLDGQPAAIVLGRQAADREHYFARMALAPIDRQLHLATNHQLGGVIFVGLARQTLADHPAAPDDCDPVGDLEHLVQLVADEDDAVALIAQPPQHGEDLGSLLRSQNGRGLIEDKDSRITVERLEDLDPLLPAHRQPAHALVRINLEAESSTQLADLLCCSATIDEHRTGHRFQPELDVLGDSQNRYQHEVLMDHADPACDGI